MADIKDAVAKLAWPRAMDPSEVARLTAAVKPALDAVPQLREQMRNVFGAIGPSSEIAKLAAAAKPALDATNQMQKLMSAVGEHIRPSIEGLAARGAVAELSRQMASTKLTSLMAAARPTVDAISLLRDHASTIANQMRPTIEALAGNSALSGISRQIADQYKSIDALKLQRDVEAFQIPRISEMAEAPRFPEIRIPPNPIHETNKQLARIEKRFDRIEAVAVESASIATGLQASAADFLVKFEKAADANNQATKRAIRTGVCAILIALAIPIAQIIYTEYWRAPIDAAAAQLVITDLKKDMTELKIAQRDAADRLSEALAQSNGDVSVTLKEIRDLLSKQNHTTK